MLTAFTLLVNNMKNKTKLIMHQMLQLSKFPPEEFSPKDKGS